MRAGKLDDLQPGAFGIVLGAELAQALRVRLGEKVTLIAPQGLVTPAAVLPRVKQFTVVGVFEAGMFEFDSGLALIPCVTRRCCIAWATGSLACASSWTNSSRRRAWARSLRLRWATCGLPTGPAAMPTSSVRLRWKRR